MYFDFSKVAGALLDPLNLIAILFIFGALLALEWPKLGRGFITAGAAIFLIFGLLPVGYNAMVWLEIRYERPAQLPARVDGILMLGGSIDTHLTGHRPGYAMNEQGERILETLMFAERYPGATLIFSGGNNSLSPNDIVPETHYIRELLEEAELMPADRQVIFEDAARNTEENINNTLAYLMAYNMDRGTWVIVSSAYHMPRVATLVDSSGWQARIIYWPVDYRTDGLYRWIPQSFDILQQMKLATLALHEMIGRLSYRITGKA